VESVGDLEGQWDADRLSQMLSNLVGNACQHGDPGTPVRIGLDGTRPETIRIEIVNQGVIPKEYLPQIFEPMRSNERRARRDGSSGLGLGLYITREIARAHGGKISVESNASSGTRFIVELPRRSASDPKKP
jgi:signal transduction histidine kinase